MPENAIAAISPYLTEHINRFGDYTSIPPENRPSQTTATPSDRQPRSHEIKWHILSRIIAIPHKQRNSFRKVSLLVPSESIFHCTSTSRISLTPTSISIPTFVGKPRLRALALGSASYPRT